MLHSVAAFPLPSPIFTTFLDRLRSYGNDSLWADLSVDGDGEWIGESATHGSLRIAHDGSYMAKKLQVLCSAGVIFYCCHTKLCLGNPLQSAPMQQAIIGGNSWGWSLLF